MELLAYTQPGQLHTKKYRHSPIEIRLRILKYATQNVEYTILNYSAHKEP